MLFPNHSEDELKQVLAEVNFDLDEAITAIIGKDNLANAPSADELLDDLDYIRPPEINGESSPSDQDPGRLFTGDTLSTRSLKSL